MVSRDWFGVWYEIRRGKKAPIVFLHGAGSNHSIWFPYLERFKGHTIVLLDLPGHGMSQNVPYRSIEDAAAKVSDVLTKEGLKGSVMVGQCLGGVVAELCSRRVPSRVSQTIIVSPFSSMTARGSFLMRLTAGLLVRFSRRPGPPKPFQDYSRWLDSPLWMFSIVDLRGTYLNTHASSVRDLLRFETDWASVCRPCLILIGKDDVLVSRAALQRVTSRSPKVTLKALACHHLLVTHAKDELIREIEERMDLPGMGR